MSAWHHCRSAALATVVLLAPGAARAQATFLGIDADRAAPTNALAAEAAFRATLTASGTETFAGDVLAEPQPLVFGSFGTGLIVDPDPFAFNQISSGATTFGLPGRTSYHTATGGFTATPIVFSFGGQPVGAFGFFAVGSNSVAAGVGALSLRLDFFSGATNVFTLPVANPFTSSDNVVFAGMSGLTFDRVEVRGQNADGISFNDVTIGSVGGSVVPEPGSVVLVATGVLVLAGVGHRRRHA
jgi:hypothetical protein